jgi:hypothetical protein
MTNIFFNIFILKTILGLIVIAGSFAAVIGYAMYKQMEDEIEESIRAKSKSSN